MSRKQAPEGLCNAKDAIRALGVSQTTFYTMVNTNQLKKITPPGRKEGFYSIQEIDNLARTYHALKAPFAEEKLDFGLALAEDLPAIHELVASVSGGPSHAVPVEVLKAWIRRNPQAIHILRHKTEILGYIAAFPLERETLYGRLTGKYFNRTIPIDDIGVFTPNAEMLLYVAEMAVKHSPQHLKNNEPDGSNPDPHARQLGARLIRDTLRFLNGLKQQGTIITELYAVGTSKFGIQMSRDLGMVAMTDLPSGVREDRIPFKLDLRQDSSESVLIKRLLKKA